MKKTENDCKRCGSYENVKYNEDFETYFCAVCLKNIFTNEMTLESLTGFDTDVLYINGDYPIPKHVLRELPSSADPLFDIYESNLKYNNYSNEGFNYE